LPPSRAFVVLAALLGVVLAPAALRVSSSHVSAEEVAAQESTHTSVNVAGLLRDGDMLAVRP
jgi:hypothetical protein